MTLLVSWTSSVDQLIEVIGVMHEDLRGRAAQVSKLVQEKLWISVRFERLQYRARSRWSGPASGIEEPFQV